MKNNEDKLSSRVKSFVRAMEHDPDILNHWTNHTAMGIYKSHRWQDPALRGASGTRAPSSPQSWRTVGEMLLVMHEVLNETKHR